MPLHNEEEEGLNRRHTRLDRPSDARPGQDDMRGQGADHMRLMPHPGRARIAGPAIGLDGGSVGNVGLDDGAKALRRAVVDRRSAASRSCRSPSRVAATTGAPTCLWNASPSDRQPRTRLSATAWSRASRCPPARRSADGICCIQRSTLLCPDAMPCRDRIRCIPEPASRHHGSGERRQRDKPCSEIGQQPDSNRSAPSTVVT